jgi:hypothetical protein
MWFSYKVLERILQRKITVAFNFIKENSVLAVLVNLRPVDEVLKLHTCWLFRMEKISKVKGESSKSSKLHGFYLKQVLVHAIPSMDC